MRSLRVTRSARADVREILRWSEQNFGATVRQAYEELLVTALTQLVVEPDHPGVKTRSDLASGVLSFHLTSAAQGMRPGPSRIRKPRHVIFFREWPGSVEILRVLHDAMDHARHEPFL